MDLYIMDLGVYLESGTQRHSRDEYADVKPHKRHSTVPSWSLPGSHCRGLPMASCCKLPSLPHQSLLPLQDAVDVGFVLWQMFSAESWRCKVLWLLGLF